MLIVEPDRGIADLIAEVVKLVGAMPILATDGYEALPLIRAWAPAVVVTALVMPRMLGEALVRAIRREWGNWLPVILISGSPSVDRLAVGADAVLAKPFSVADLQSLLNRYLGACTTDQFKDAVDRPQRQPFEQDQWGAAASEPLHSLSLKPI